MKARESLRAVAAGEVYTRSNEVVFRPATRERPLLVIHGEVLERLRLLAPGHELRDRSAFDYWPVIEPPHELDDAVGVGIWQGFQQGRVHYGEDGGVGADAERERENGNGCEAWILAEDPQRVAKVLQECLH